MSEDLILGSFSSETLLLSSGNFFSSGSAVISVAPTLTPIVIELPTSPVATLLQPVEPNDTISTAINTGLNSGQPGTYILNASIGDNFNIAAGLDVDFFQVQLNAGDRLTIDLDTPYYSYQLSSALRLFDSNGNQLAYDNYSSAPGEGYNYGESYLDFSALAAGTYFIGVSTSGNTSYNPFIEGSGNNSYYSTGSYTINISVTPPNKLNGTAKDDILTGTDGIDHISGFGGDDMILANGESDQIWGGNGSDLIYGGDGNDLAQGDQGHDTLYGQYGNDTLYGNLGNDSLIGDFGRDVLYGGNGKDTLIGGEESDLIYGGTEADQLYGNYGEDSLYGEDGNDTLSGGGGYDVLYGGKGVDNLFGNEDNDILYGQDGNDRLTGGSNSDLLEGGKGNDTLIGVDPLSGWGKNDIDTLTGGTGKDTFILGDQIRSYYEDESYLSSGESNYALITDFNAFQDIIQLHGSSQFYSLDFYTSEIGSVNAAIIYDIGELTRGEVIGVIQNVSSNLSLSSNSFIFV